MASCVGMLLTDRPLDGKIAERSMIAHMNQAEGRNTGENVIAG